MLQLRPTRFAPGADAEEPGGRGTRVAERGRSCSEFCWECSAGWSTHEMWWDVLRLLGPAPVTCGEEGSIRWSLQIISFAGRDLAPCAYPICFAESPLDGGGPRRCRGDARNLRVCAGREGAERWPRRSMGRFPHARPPIVRRHRVCGTIAGLHTHLSQAWPIFSKVGWAGLGCFQWFPTLCGLRVAEELEA